MALRSNASAPAGIRRIERKKRECIKYREQIYAGVLGKMIGVYLGRPVEGWSYDKIRETFDEVKYYVHEKVGVPLIVADDDISGTFAFSGRWRTMDMTGNCRRRRLGTRG